MKQFKIGELVDSGQVKITFHTHSTSLATNAREKSSLSTKLLPFNPMQQSQRCFHEILIELSSFIEKTLEITPDMLLGIQREYCKAVHEYYKGLFKNTFKELHSTSQYKRVVLNYESSQKCHLKGVMNFSIPVRFQQTFTKV